MSTVVYALVVQPESTRTKGGELKGKEEEKHERRDHTIQRSTISTVNQALQAYSR